MRAETLFYLAGATFSFLRDVHGGRQKGQSRGLGDALQNLLKKTERSLINKPVKKKLHKVTTIDDRVGHIIIMIRKHRHNPRAREVAMKVITKKDGLGNWKIPEKDWLGEVREMFRFVRRHARYVRDPYGLDTYVAPLRTLTQYKGGDCDDQHILLGTLLQSVGYPVRLKIIQTPPNQTFNHIYLLVGLPPNSPTKWIAADTTSGKNLGYQVPKGYIIRQKIYDV